MECLIERSIECSNDDGRDLLGTAVAEPVLVLTRRRILPRILYSASIRMAYMVMCVDMCMDMWMRFV